MAITASLNRESLLKMEAMWDQSKSQNRAQWDVPVDALQNFLTRQTMRVVMPAGQGATCTSFTVWFPDWTAFFEDTGYNGATPEVITDCTLPSGPSVESLGKTYSANLFPGEKFTVPANICNNQLMFEDYMAEQIQVAMAKLRQKLCASFVSFLDANISPNVAAGMFPEFTIASAVTNITTPNWADQTLLAKLNATAVRNRLPMDYLILDSFNFGINEAIAPTLGLNDNQRSVEGFWAQFRSKYTQDIWNVAANTSYIYNPHMVGLHNIELYPRFPEQRINDTQVFTLPDPVLRYNRVEVIDEGNGQSRLASRGLQPIRYNVEVQDVCAPQDANGALRMQKNVRVHFVGGLNLGAQANTGSTTANRNGILKLVKTAV